MCIRDRDKAEQPETASVEDSRQAAMCLTENRAFGVWAKLGEAKLGFPRSNRRLAWENVRGCVGVSDRTLSRRPNPRHALLASLCPSYPEKSKGACFFSRVSARLCAGSTRQRRICRQSICGKAVMLCESLMTIELSSSRKGDWVEQMIARRD